MKLGLFLQWRAYKVEGLHMAIIKNQEDEHTYTYTRRTSSRAGSKYLQSFKE